MKNINFKETTGYEISIGLKSMISRENILHVDDAKEIICNYLYENKVNFSLRVINGGYTYADDSFQTEKTIVLTFINGDYDFVKELAKKLKMLLEQESILLVKKDLEIVYL